MPETAVDLETLEVIAHQGIRFTILAPHQVRRVRRLGSEAWQLVDAVSVDTTMPYLVHLPSGADIAVFVHDGAIAHGVSFGDLLKNGDRFLARLLGGFRGDTGGLVHIATDGETYGHHHRFGEMALAYVLDRIETRSDVRLTNYGEWLEKNPPTHEAEIAPNTSWSCAHGVERWRSNCGCTTDNRPGWNQAWRAPLRAAMDTLQNRVDSLFAARAGALFRDPWAARDEYIDVLLDPAPESIDAFFARHEPRVLSSDERVDALTLLEMQRHALLTATSCGWYFADLAGIEAVQILRYAGRAIELAEGLGGRGVEAAFLDRLAKGKSNDPARGDGRAIYERGVRPAAVNAVRATKNHAVAALFDQPSSASRGYVIDTLEQVERRTLDARLVAGHARVNIRRTGEMADVVYAAVRGGSNVPCVGAAAAAATVGGIELDLVRLFDEAGVDAAARRIAEAFPAPVRLDAILTARDLADLLGDVARDALEAIEDGASSLVLLDDPRIAHSGALRGLALFALHRRLAACASSSPPAIGDLERLLDQARTASVPVSGALIAHDLALAIAREIVSGRLMDLSVSSLDLLARAALRARSLASDVHLWRAQEVYLGIANRLRETDTELPDAVLEAFGHLGDALGARPADAAR
jgi:hypothetical protein